MATDKLKDTLETARTICDMLEGAGLSGSDGCLALGLAYGYWIEAQPGTDREMVSRMMVLGTSAALSAFELRRDVRDTWRSILAKVEQLARQ